MAWSQALLDFEAKLREEGRQEGLQTGLQTGRQEGLQTGLQTGRQEGRREALQVTLYNLFLARFGTVDGALERAIVSIVSLSPEAYNQIFPRLLTLSAAELVAQFSGIENPN